MKNPFRLKAIFVLPFLWMPLLYGQPQRMASAPTMRRPELQSRPLTNKTLTDKEKQRYATKLASTKKRSKISARLPEETAKALRFLQQANVDLEYGQEQLANQTCQEAWKSLAASWKNEPSLMGGQSKYLRKHFASLKSFIRDDAAAALTLLNDLNPFYVEGLTVIKDSKQSQQYVNPLAEVWSQLTREFELDQSHLATAVDWIAIDPTNALINKRLKRQEQIEYQAALVQAETEFDRLKETLRCGYGTPNVPPEPVRDRGGVNPPGAAEQLQRALDNAKQRDRRTAVRRSGVGGTVPSQESQLLLLAIENKRVPFTMFYQALVHARYAQEKSALLTSRRAWTVLLHQYRKEPQSIAAYDGDIHLELLDDLQSRDPVRAWVLMGQLEEVYQQAASVNPAFVLDIADHWIDLTERLPLDGASLTRVAGWLQQASQIERGPGGIYTQKLQVIQKQMADREKPHPQPLPPNTKANGKQQESRNERRPDKQPRP